MSVRERVGLAQDCWASVCPGFMKESHLRNVILDYVNMNASMKKKTVPVLLLVMCTLLMWTVWVFCRNRLVNAFSQRHVISACIPLISYCPVFIFEVKGSLMT